jgi:hypothetical protein
MSCKTRTLTLDDRLGHPQIPIGRLLALAAPLVVRSGGSCLVQFKRGDLLLYRLSREWLGPQTITVGVTANSLRKEILDPPKVALFPSSVVAEAMERTFPIGDKSVFVRELILSGELGTQIWDAVRRRMSAFNLTL